MNPEKTGHEGRGPLSPDRRPGRVPGRPAAAHRRRRRPTSRRATASRTVRSAAISTRCFAGSPAGGRRVLRGRHPARRSNADAGQRHAPGPGGHALEQAVLPLRRGQVARGARLRSVQGRRARQAPRNDHWHHMYNGDVISMPDKWEYPWYAAWDLAFHVLALTLVDPDFGKQQLKLMLRERYMHPNGQIPAYEWNFGDVNPPVHAWSTIFTYRLEKAQNGRGRHGLAQELLPEAAAELHLVGQPQGPLRAERLRGRLPGPGQHRRLRPQRAAADRRLPGTGRRHRLDGPVLPEHARDRRGAGA